MERALQCQLDPPMYEISISVPSGIGAWALTMAVRLSKPI